jgi:hypothetical protein
MSIREFSDSAGVKWRVWSTVPRSPGVDESLRAGWLTFESTLGRRRLAPIPRGWEEASPERLDLMCRAADAAWPTGFTPDPEATDAPEAPLDGDEPPAADPGR